VPNEPIKNTIKEWELQHKFKIEKQVINNKFANKERNSTCSTIQLTQISESLNYENLANMN
jgi:hypothetical protein